MSINNLKKDIIDFYSNNESMYGIVNMFKEKFIEIYNKKDNSEKKDLIINYKESYYRRWYYSSFVNKFSISPANYLNSYINTRSEENIIVVPTLEPIARKDKLEELTQEFRVYSIDNHPFIRDFKTIMDGFYPAVVLNDVNMLEKSIVNELMKKVSVKDFHYINYIVKLSIEMEFLKKMPSLYANNYVPSPEYEEFLSMSSEEKLRKIIEGTIKLSSKELINICPLAFEEFSEKGIENMLRNPIGTDELFNSIFKDFDLNFQEISMKLEEDSDSQNSMLMMYVCLLGIFYDIWFVTIFGYYLQLIQPIYAEPYNIQSDVELLNEDDEECLEGLFSPCSHYDLTFIGENFFMEGKKSEKHQKIKANDKFNVIYDFIKFSNGGI